MRNLIVVVSLFVAQSAFAQTPQNAPACAELREDIAQLVGRLMWRGADHNEAMQAAEVRLEIYRLTQHPCYLPPGVPQNPACVALREQTFQFMSNLIARGHSLDEAMPAALRVLQLRRRAGDPCFFPPPPKATAPAPAPSGIPYGTSPNPRSGMPSASSSVAVARTTLLTLLTRCMVNVAGLPGSFVPILAPLPLNGDAGGIADLDPDPARAGPIGAVDLL